MKSLKELSEDELRQLAENNEQLRAEIAERVYEDNMFAQGEDYEQIFGKNNRTIEYHDHYQSFYLTISDHDHFVENIDRECLTIDGMKYYDRAKSLLEQWQNMDYDEQDENSELYEKIERVNEQLLREIESFLHDYENITKDEMNDYLDIIMDGVSDMSEWKTDGEIVYQYMTRVYK